MTIDKTKTRNSLTREQKQAVGILSIGTFLEYFDLMLYVHMAVLLNELFFPNYDPFTNSLLSAFAFCSTFVFRPIGAYLIGRIGDKMGRRYTVIITSFAMAATCIIMANLPTYNQVGIISAWAVTICRIIQGISSMGETVGAEIYLTEMIKPPLAYPAVAFTNICSFSGTMCALFIAKISLNEGYNWRVAFWIGAVVALVGLAARRNLREAADFADARQDITRLCNKFNIDEEEVTAKLWFKEVVNKKLAISLFFIQLACPVYHLYFIYIHGANVLKNSFNYTTTEVINHNFILSLFDLSSVILMTCLVRYINPLKILKIKWFISVPFFFSIPFLLNNVTSPLEFAFIQLFVIFFMPSEFPAVPIFYKSFPIFKRFTSVCLIFAVSRALMYVVSSVGLAYLIKFYGNYGLLILFVPVIILYGWGLFNFIRYEAEKGLDSEDPILINP
jgi:MFS transporter, MHS family, proline/betaine transporter